MRVTTFDIRLRQARTAKGLTQADVADHLNVKRVNVTKWEADEYMPGARRLAPLADFLGVSEEWLLSNRGDGPAVRTRSSLQEAEALLRQLPPDELERELAYLRSRIARPAAR